MKKLIFLLMFLLTVVVGRTQIVQRTVSFGANYTINGQTHIPIIFSGFDTVSAVALVFTYDTTLLKYNHFTTTNPAFDNSLVNAPTNPPYCSNTLRIAWWNGPDAMVDTLMILVFDNKTIGCTNLSWDTFTYGNCEIAHWVSYQPPMINIISTCFTDSYICVVPFTVNITGSVKYHNGYNIYPVTVDLYDSCLSWICSYQSNDGNYEFNELPVGVYSVNAFTNHATGGLNSADALITAKYFAGVEELDPIQKLAADVNNSGNINSIDALFIMKKFTQTIPSFGFSPWIFDWKTINATSNQVVNIEGICRGDVNNSFMNSNSNKMVLTNNVRFKINQLNAWQFDLYIVADPPMDSVASISLAFVYNNVFSNVGVTFHPPLLNGNPMVNTISIGSSHKEFWFKSKSWCEGFLYLWS